MKTLLTLFALAGAIVVGSAASEQWAGTGKAFAQATGSSACFQNCANVRKWPAQQCRQYCRGRTKRK
jgi:hypothetical protein